MTAREQLEAEAEELFPTDDTTYISIHMDDLNSDLQRVFIKGRTASAEQWEASARAIQRQYDPYTPFESELESDQDEYFRQAHAALEAAGFYVEATNEHP